MDSPASPPEGGTLLLVLTAGHRSAAAEMVAELGAAARARGLRVRIFLAGDGVLQAPALDGVGNELALCEADRRWRHPAPAGKARLGSLRDLARWCQDADRVLVFS